MVNYAESYQSALAQAYPKSMYFGALFSTPNNTLYKVVEGGKTVKIPVLTVKGRKDGDRDTIGGFSRNHENDWEIKTLTNHRIWETLVHPMDITQTNMVMSIQNATQVMNSQEKLPEKQKFLVSKLHELTVAANGKVETAALTSSNVLSYVDKIAESLDENAVPSAGRMLYVTPVVNTMIKNAVSRYLSGSDGALTRTISRIDEFTVVVVPSDLMKTVYNFTEGAVPGVGAKQIHMFAAHPLSVLTPENYTFVSMQEPSTLTEGKYVYFEESFEDVFILNERKCGLYFITEA